ncbi:PIG-U-domain-containing protein [Stereum hirsutum FP-91666 SS1]|uniref:PIG-U-domain-containing protein n=1 Tax=Stereum hirsutum (strain FP-91666) TaxID=721885 RepID=UPI000444A8AA|nr:PIG-U-domain-containing protein [Stereum hirsutum FP-91666 SS1]EIM81126.1 PIG-U-domain-containing protein [Stereum hirsutum FP-91666 SS1]
MVSDLIFPALSIFRLLLALSPLGRSLKDDPQLSSPLTSYSSLSEGTYLFRNGIDPYSGGTFRHSPLYLAAFTTILPQSEASCAVIWWSIDIMATWALLQIWRARKAVDGDSRDWIIAAAYLFNPYLLFSTLALSTSPLDNALLLLSIMFACKRKAPPALLTLAIAIHLSLPSILILPPVLLLLISEDATSHLANPSSSPILGLSVSQLRKAVSPLLIEFVLYFLVLTGVSTTIAGGWGWVGNTWGAGLTLPDLTPNPGLWWYFFTEMFDHFRPFFLMVFSAHLLIYVFPVCAKFQHDPLFAVFVLLGILGIFKPYPTLADPGLVISLLSLFSEIYPHLRHPIVTALLHAHSSLLLPLFHHLWITTGTGNANFFYASTLVFGIANGAVVIDAAWAGLRVAVGDVDLWDYPLEGGSSAKDGKGIRREVDKPKEAQDGWIVVQE